MCVYIFIYLYINVPDTGVFIYQRACHRRTRRYHHPAAPLTCDIYTCFRLTYIHVYIN